MWMEPLRIVQLAAWFKVGAHLTFYPGEIGEYSHDDDGNDNDDETNDDGQNLWIPTMCWLLYNYLKKKNDQKKLIKYQTLRDLC